jgi:L-lactate dehydrogenase (cytochrome)
MSVLNCHRVMDFRAHAKARLPKAIFDYIDGGADDERTLGWNHDRYAELALMPRALVNVAELNTRTTALGHEMALPFYISPTAGQRLFHHEGEAGVARAAHAYGLVYGLSTLATSTIETVGAATPGPKWFQVYVWKDRGLVKSMIERARAAGFTALMLTVDAPIAGKRERDLHNGFSIPPRIGARRVLEAFVRPEWTFNYLTHPKVGFEVLGDIEGITETAGVMEFINKQFDRTITWDDAAWMIREWGGEFAIKGLIAPDDCVRAAEVGATGVVLSNHGGRQLDSCLAPIDVLEPCVDAAGDRLDVLIDGGLYRGVDIVKALCLGAKAVGLGRAVLYSHAAFGEAGVRRMLAILKDEIDRALALMGVSDVKALNRSYVQRLR